MVKIPKNRDENKVVYVPDESTPKQGVLRHEQNNTEIHRRVNMLNVPQRKEIGESAGQMCKMTLDMMNVTGWIEKKTIQAEERCRLEVPKQGP